MQQQGEPHETVGSDVQVTITFITKLPAQYRVPETPVTVPANLTRYGLSQIINHLLALDQPLPFDFLINDELIRLPLHEFLLAREISTEATIQVEYIPAILPPTPQEEHKHDDWISCVTSLDSITGTIIVSGCYDGIVRFYTTTTTTTTDNNNTTTVLTHSFQAHDKPIKAIAAIPYTNNTQNQWQLITCSDDCTARVWSITTTTTTTTTTTKRQSNRKSTTHNNDNTTAAVMIKEQLIGVLTGHTGGIESIAVRPDGRRCATAGWDCSVLLWKCGDDLPPPPSSDDHTVDDNDTTIAKKKQKQSNGSTSTTAINTTTTLVHYDAIGSLQGHSQCISCIAWPENNTIISGSWDHSLAVWDVEMETKIESYLHNKAIHCIAVSSRNNGRYVVFGGPDKIIRLWDRKSSSGNNTSGGDSSATAVKSFSSSHSDWISCIAWHPTLEHYFISTSYDGSAKLWDIRSTVPLHTLPGVSDDKLLCCMMVESKSDGGDGDKSVCEVVTGGADCVLRRARVEVYCV